MNTDRTMVVQHYDDPQVRWWTWASGPANALLAAALARVLPNLTSDYERLDNRYLRLGAARGASPPRWQLRAASTVLTSVESSRSSTSRRSGSSSFTELLSPDLAHATLAARTADHGAAARVLEHRVVDSRQ